MSTEQRERLRRLADQRSSTMTETLGAALDSLQREQFYREMAEAQARFASHADEQIAYDAERAAWLDADLS